MKPQKAQPRNLPYLTKDQLEAPIKSVLVKVSGKYTKRGDQRKEVWEDDYETDIEVPEQWNMGHVKLGVNRYVRQELKGIRARTYNVNKKAKPTPCDEKRIVSFFMSAQSLIDNQSLKTDYKRRKLRNEQVRQAMADGTYAPPPFEDTTNYGDDGLPPLTKEPVSSEDDDD